MPLPCTSCLTVPMGASRYFAETLIRNPGYFDWLIEPGALSEESAREKLLDALRRDVSRPNTVEQKWGAMRRFRNRESLRIGLRDLLGIASIEMITAELALLADASPAGRLRVRRAGAGSKVWGSPVRDSTG